MTTLIKEEDLVASVADGLQFISYYHPADYIRHLAQAYEREESPAAKDAIAQILVNSRMAALGRRPICQDTGTVVAFLRIGMGVRFETTRALTELGNELHEQGYKRPLFIMNSGGGANPLQRTSAVETYNAGPVAGVIGGAHMAEQY